MANKEKAAKDLIFVVNPYTEACSSVRHCLEQAGYTVSTFTTSEVFAEIEDKRPSLVLLSLIMPGGLSLCRRILGSKVLKATAIIFLLDDAGEEQPLLVLNCGDDCMVKPSVVKPFRPGDLVARVQTLLGRLPSQANPLHGEAADLVIDSLAMKLSVRGNDVRATALEFHVIEYLAHNRGQVFSREVLLRSVWGDKCFVTPRRVDALIRRIREKIEPDHSHPTYVKTVRGVGYRFDAVATWQSTSNDVCDCAACRARASSSTLIYEKTTRRAKDLSQPIISA